MLGAQWGSHSTFKAVSLCGKAVVAPRERLLVKVSWRRCILRRFCALDAALVARSFVPRLAIDVLVIVSRARLCGLWSSAHVVDGFN